MACNASCHLQVSQAQHKSGFSFPALILGKVKLSDTMSCEHLKVWESRDWSCWAWSHREACHHCVRGYEGRRLLFLKPRCPPASWRLYSKAQLACCPSQSGAPHVLLHALWLFILLAPQVASPPQPYPHPWSDLRKPELCWHALL